MVFFKQALAKTGDGECSILYILHPVRVLAGIKFLNIREYVLKIYGYCQCKLIERSFLWGSR